MGRNSPSDPSSGSTADERGAQPSSHNSNRSHNQFDPSAVSGGLSSHQGASTSDPAFSYPTPSSMSPESGLPAVRDIPTAAHARNDDLPVLGPASEANGYPWPQTSRLYYHRSAPTEGAWSHHQFTTGRNVYNDRNQSMIAREGHHELQPRTYGGMVQRSPSITTQPSQSPNPSEASGPTTEHSHEENRHRHFCPAPDCDKRFITLREMKKHFKKVHEKLEEFRCQDCVFTTHYTGTASQHHTNQHPDCTAESASQCIRREELRPKENRPCSMCISQPVRTEIEWAEHYQQHIRSGDGQWLRSFDKIMLNLLSVPAIQGKWNEKRPSTGAPHWDARDEACQQLQQWLEAGSPDHPQEREERAEYLATLAATLCRPQLDDDEQVSQSSSSPHGDL